MTAQHAAQAAVRDGASSGSTTSYSYSDSYTSYSTGYSTYSTSSTPTSRSTHPAAPVVAAPLPPVAQPVLGAVPGAAVAESRGESGEETASSSYSYTYSTSTNGSSSYTTSSTESSQPHENATTPQNKATVAAAGEVSAVGDAESGSYSYTSGSYDYESYPGYSTTYSYSSSGYGYYDESSSLRSAGAKDRRKTTTVSDGESSYYSSYTYSYEGTSYDYSTYSDTSYSATTSASATIEAHTATQAPKRQSKQKASTAPATTVSSSTYYSASSSYAPYSASESYYTYSTSGGETSSYSSSSYSSYSSRSSSAATAEKQAVAKRELLVLQTPPTEPPLTPPAAPRRCFVTRYSPDDVVSAVLRYVGELQGVYERRRQALGLAPNDTVERTSRDEKVSAGGRAGLTPEGHYSRRSVRLVLGQVLRMSHVERHAAMRGVSGPPVEHSTFATVLDRCVAARVKDRVARAFLALDPYRLGELPMSQTVDLLQRLGLAASPLIAGTAINIALSQDGTRPVLLVESHGAALEGAPQTTKTNQEDAASPAGLAKRTVDVCALIQSAQHALSVRWAEGTIYLEDLPLCHGIRENYDYQRLKTFIESATYVCVLVQLYTIHSPAQGAHGAAQAEAAPHTTRPATAACTVQYPRVVRAVLLATPPPTHDGRAREPVRLLFLQNLLRQIFNPAAALARYARGEELPLYNGKDAVESTLQATNDTREKRWRNLIPETTHDGAHFTPPSTSPTGGTALTKGVADSAPLEVRVVEFVLRKVQLPASPPRGARCFCLVSAVTPERVFLPAVELPVRASALSRSKGGKLVTWTFARSKGAQDEAAVRFCGPATDQLYIECCYETREQPNSDPQGSPPRPTIWSAGYALVTVAELASGELSVREGSLLDDAVVAPPVIVSDESTSSTSESSGYSGSYDYSYSSSSYSEDTSYSGSYSRDAREATTMAASSSMPAGATTSARPDEAVKAAGCLPFRFALRARRGVRGAGNTPLPLATHIKVTVLPPPKTSRHDAAVNALMIDMPARYLVLRRHAALVARLRTAVRDVGEQCAHAGQALRQYAVRQALTVAANDALMDQLAALWRYKQTHAGRKVVPEVSAQSEELLRCASALAALHNCAGKNPEGYTQLLIQRKRLKDAYDKDAPQIAVHI